MVLVEFIQEHRWWVLALSLPLIVIYGRVLVLAAFGPSTAPTKPVTAPIRRLPPKPPQPGMVKPSGMTPPPEGRQEVLPGSLEAGATAHQKAGSAKTVKLPVTPKPTDSPFTAKKPTTGTDTAADTSADSEAEALEGLFGKRDELPSESPTAAVRRKASRMEELGFHHGIANDLTKSDAKPAPAIAPGTPATIPAATPASPAILPDGTPRSSTAELTSILERIDKFLAEDTPAKPAPTLPPSKTATTAVIKAAADQAKPAEAEPADVVQSAPAAPAAEASVKATEAMPKPADAASAKPDPLKKTQPMWARADAQDDDIDAPAGDEKKPDGQQRLF